MWDHAFTTGPVAAGYSVDFTRPWLLTTLACVAIILWISARRPATVSRGRRRLSLLLRAAAITALALALAGARLVRRSNLLCLSLVVDQSASIDPDRRSAELQRLAVGLRAMQPNQRLAVLGFAGQAVLQRLASETAPPAPPAPPASSASSAAAAAAGGPAGALGAMQGDFRPEFTDIGQALRLAAIGGRVAAIGIPPVNDITITTSYPRRKQLMVQFIRRSAHSVRQAMELVATGKVDIKPWITHRFPLARVAEAFELVDGYQDGVVKAVIEM